jgi:hypothetical protein
MAKINMIRWQDQQCKLRRRKIVDERQRFCFGISQIGKSKGKRFNLAICEIAITILTDDSRRTCGEQQRLCFRASQIEKSKGKRFKLVICEIAIRSGPSDLEKLRRTNNC